jgi:hypothetical protein
VKHLMEQKDKGATGADRRQYVNFAFYKVDPVCRSEVL